MYSKIITFIILFFLFSSNLWAKQSLIVDTDMNTDDAIALLYLLKNKDVDIRAITVEANTSVHCYPALKNIMGLIKLTHHKVIPMACGSEKTLPGGHRFPSGMFHETDTLSETASLLPQKIINPTYHAVALLASVLQKTQKPIDIVALGAHTNLAQFLKKFPSLKNKIHRIYMLGGALSVSGNLQDVDANNKNNSAEWNIYFDPLASSIVFHSGIPIFLIPLDVTNQFPINKDFFLTLKKYLGTPAADYFYEILNGNQSMLVNGTWFFWDPLVAVISIHPEFALFEKQKITIVQSPEEKSGTTRKDNVHGNGIHVCQSVNKQQFEQELLQVLAH